MNQLPKLLISLGIILIIVGLLWQVGGKYLSLGKLPGDIFVKRGNTTFYFPIVTSIVISILLSLVFFIIGRFR
ncbi:DUF2905 domain-containing protein [Evansella cellulosilytica]|uniref:DUF2905 domain-containing protein n=1 Tax=Evansella cellulosilytica (strain ATCC 21833 / DSM 2522 / FERM P-1141 / JCM 9156 / N-4) TaxID=649639 RepID=E6TV71_EVAC2|nr:DUF2905 domain-containing protein [Evansella cellulosilytica]ADU29755.1 hypothetical protein Bcell_1492 [Evansella cellulosilytica DSM 2522]